MDLELSRSALQTLLLEKIPIYGATRTEVVLVEREKVELSASILPNLNLHGTAFGGSLAALAVLCGWCLLYTRVYRECHGAQVVIQKQQMDFLEPIQENFKLTATLRSGSNWIAFLEALRRHRKARIAVRVRISAGERAKADFVGVYVALHQLTADWSGPLMKGVG